MTDPFLGINSPVRLLREQWQSPIDLAQELYAMFTAKGPKEINDTLTIRVGAGQPALRIVRDDGDTIINEGPTHNFGVSKDATPTATAVPGRRPRPKLKDDSQRPFRQPFGDGSTPRAPRPEQATSEFAEAAAAYATPAVEFDAPTRFSRPVIMDRPIFGAEPLFVDQATGRVRTFEEAVQEKQRSHKFQPQLGSSSGTPAYFGTVQSGNGGEWIVTLFESGASGSTGSTVTVTIPYIDESETAPVGVTVGPIFLISSEYIYQPPVWLP
jgi:hypothetical protein